MSAIGKNELVGNDCLSQTTGLLGTNVIVPGYIMLQLVLGVVCVVNVLCKYKLINTLPFLLVPILWSKKYQSGGRLSR